MDISLVRSAIEVLGFLVLSLLGLGAQIVQTSKKADIYFEKLLATHRRPFFLI